MHTSGVLIFGLLYFTVLCNKNETLQPYHEVRVMVRHFFIDY